MMSGSREMADILGLDAAAGPITRFELIDRLDAGLPLASLAKVASRVAPADGAFAFRLVPRATLARRRKTSEPRLSADEGAKVARLASVWTLAREIWDSDDAARAFLNRPHALLGGKCPLDLVLRSEFGGPMVETILNGLRYGSAA